MSTPAAADAIRQIAIARALRIIGAHPRVSNCTPSESVEDGYLLAIDTNLPSRWKAKGASETGVKSVELVALIFPSTFPTDAPNVFLREDFDRSHPHLDPAGPDGLPRPCFFDGNRRDLMRWRGIYGVIDQIVDWLEKAARAQLMDFSQGWEPIRRDQLDDHISLHPDKVRAFADEKGGSSWVSVPFALQKPAGYEPYYYLCLEPSKIQLNSAVLKEMASINHSVGLLLWPGKNKDGSLFISDRYLPETITTVAELRERATELGVGKELAQRLKFLGIFLREAKLSTGIVLSVLIMARRPCNVSGQDSDLELLPYVIEVGDASGLSKMSKARVRTAAQHDAISPELLARLSDRPLAKNAHWTLIGAGSVGSKLAVHLARQGAGPTTVIDRSVLQPHNFARHALMPWYFGEGLVVQKSLKLGEALCRFERPPWLVYDDVVDLCADPALREKREPWKSDTKLVVDTTGSHAVTDSLCRPDVRDTRPRALEACLLGQGRVAYVGLEGGQNNPCLQDLAAESYRLMAETPDIGRAALTSSGDTVAIGQGCSSVTARMPDTLLSAAVPAMTERVGGVLRADADADEPGEIAIGLIAEDLMGQTWLKTPVQPFTEVTHAGGAAPRVRISSPCVEIIDAEIETKPGSETGGVILGRFNEVTNSFHIVKTLPAPPDSKFSATEFVLGTDGLGEAINGFVESTGGVLHGLGTWHNHLRDTPASRDDLITGLKLAFGQHFPALVLIRTPSKFDCLIVEC